MELIYILFLFIFIYIIYTKKYTSNNKELFGTNPTIDIVKTHENITIYWSNISNNINKCDINILIDNDIIKTFNKDLIGVSFDKYSFDLNDLNIYDIISKNENKKKVIKLTFTYNDNKEPDKSIDIDLNEEDIKELKDNITENILCHKDGSITRNVIDINNIKKLDILPKLEKDEDWEEKLDEYSEIKEKLNKKKKYHIIIR